MQSLQVYMYIYKLIIFTNASIRCFAQARLTDGAQQLQSQARSWSTQAQRWAQCSCTGSLSQLDLGTVSYNYIQLSLKLNAELNALAQVLFHNLHSSWIWLLRMEYLLGMGRSPHRWRHLRAQAIQASSATPHSAYDIAIQHHGGI